MKQRRRRHVPAEAPFESLRGLDVDRRGCLGPPLGEQMGDFQVLDAVFGTQAHPAQQLAEIKVVARIFANPDQLGGQPRSPDCCVERRGPCGRQQRVGAHPCRGSHEGIDDRPMLLAEDPDAVVARQAVAMEPVGVHDFQFRGLRGHHGDADVGAEERVAFGVPHGDPEFVLAGVLGGWHHEVDPCSGPLPVEGLDQTHPGLAAKGLDTVRGCPGRSRRHAAGMPPRNTAPAQPAKWWRILPTDHRLQLPTPPTAGNRASWAA